METREEVKTAEEVADSENPHEAGGFVKNFISNMVSTARSEKKKEDEDEEDEGGGILTNLLSNLVSPPSVKETGEAAINGGASGVEDSESVGEKDDGNGGTRIGNLICNLFHQGESEKAAEVPMKAGEDGGGGIIDNIVSHLPASLQGDAVTTTDEATILIHSLVHD